MGSSTTHKLAESISMQSEVALAPPHEDGLIHFGDTILLTTALGGTLSANIRTRLEISQEAYQVTRTASDVPMKQTGCYGTTCPSCWRQLPLAVISRCICRDRGI